MTLSVCNCMKFRWLGALMQMKPTLLYKYEVDLFFDPVFFSFMIIDWL